MKYGRSRKQTKMDDQDHYKELEESHNEKASKEFHRKPYQNYTVEDFAKKMGINTKKVIEHE